MTRRPRFPHALPRPRLLAAASAACVVLEAPAGGGKTVLAAQLADATRARLVWLRPRHPAAQTIELVDEILAVLGATRPGLDADPATLVDAVLDACAGEPLCLVIDDADRAEGAELARLLTELVPMLDAGSSVLLCARERPAGLFGRLGAQVRLVDAATLAFTEAEIAELAGPHHDPLVVRALLAETGGWPIAVSAAIASGARIDNGGTRRALGDALAAAVADDPGASAVLDLLAVAGAVPADVLSVLVADPAAPARLATRTPLVQVEDDRYRLAEPAREAWRPAGKADIGRLAGLLAATDPAGAIEALLDANLLAEAAGLLGATAGRLPVAWVRPRLYRLPAQLRSALPPALSGLTATVDLDAAIAAAEARLATAATPSEYATGRFNLGSALTHDGQLESAATELAAARRAATDPVMAATADSWLALVRFWIGDRTGALAAARNPAAAGSPLACWVLAECALADADPAGARSAAATMSAHDPLSAVLTRVCQTKAAILEAGQARPGTEEAARAREAYLLAAGQGGLALLAAAPLHAWFLLAEHRLDEAKAVGAELRRALGRRDAASRLHAALLSLAVAELTGDADATHQASAVIAAVRHNGFAVIETEARRWLPGLATHAAGLRIGLIGRVVIEVDGHDLSMSAWHSRKAREAILLIASAGPRGLRREEIIEAVWPDREPGPGRTLLRTALTEARKVLEPGRVAGQPSTYLHADRDRVALLAEVDVVTARADAANGHDREALARLGADIAEDEPDLAALEGLRTDINDLRKRLAQRIGRDTTQPTTVRAQAYEAALAVTRWPDLAEELVALLWKAGEADRARAADAEYLA